MESQRLKHERPAQLLWAQGPTELPCQPLPGHLGGQLRVGSLLEGESHPTPGGASRLLRVPLACPHPQTASYPSMRPASALLSPAGHELFSDHVSLPLSHSDSLVS